MKRSGLLTALLSLVLFSCTRSVDFRTTNNASLEGRWRMQAVKDNTTGLTYTKPGAITGDVEITIVAVTTANGFFNGKTPTNTLYADYTLGEIDIITIPSVAATKVAETSWGLDFLYNITKSNTYSFEQDGKLRIHTEKKTLFFEKQ